VSKPGIKARSIRLEGSIMPGRLKIVIVAATSAAALTASAPVSAITTPRAPVSQPAAGMIVVFVSEGAEVVWAGTKLREYPASTECQAFPPGAHVVSNHSDRRLLFYADPFCTVPVPPPFNFIKPGYGAHVSPNGAFRAS
jgi:hypothetical protein